MSMSGQAPLSPVSIFKLTIFFVSSYGGNEHAKGSGYEILTGEGFQWKAAENGRVPQGAVQVEFLGQNSG